MPPAASAEVDRLFVAWRRDGDRQARAQLIERFLPLARKLARRYAGASEPVDDLTQVACVGLVNAVDRYDLERGTAFTSFAVPTIVGELKRYFRDFGWSLHVPRGTQETALKVEEAQRMLSARDGRSPSVAELAEYLELEIETVLEAIEAAGAQHCASLDAPHDEEDGASTLGDSLGHDDERFELVDGSVTIAVVARRLPVRERDVIAMRFIEELTQTQIAARIGVSQMQVSRILRQALTHLKELTQAPSS
ncbi:MAG: SigB/SigF/SigG family RNA polymerase sigma factor [Solirubrobacteraceae bacterium]